MDKEELLKYLGMDDGDSIEYFEEIAAFLECGDYIDSDAVFDLIKSCDMQVLSEIIGNYFDEITDSIPGDAVDLYTLLHNEKRSLMGMAANCEEETTVVQLAEELNRFRLWYSEDSNVYVRTEDEEKNEEKQVTLRDALVESRIEGISGERHLYDFTEALEYTIEEYIMSFADLLQDEETEDSMNQ